MATPLTTRLVLKIKKVARELSETSQEREFRTIWPQINSIEGWLLATEGQWLFNAARSLPRNPNIVEVGSYKGRSTCCLALGCKKKNGRVFAVDSFDGGPNLPKADSLSDFTSNLKRLGLSGFVEPVPALSAQVAATWNKPIHLLFIDGSHLYEDVLADFRGFFPYVTRGGIVAFHDVVNKDWPDVGKAWQESIRQHLTDIGYRDSLGYGRKP